MTIREALARANKQIAKKIDAALTQDVFPAIQEEEAATIYAEVYKVYTPKMYRRRGEYGGLGDRDNIEILGGKATGGVLTVVNTTEANPGGRFNKGRVTTGKNLPALVEYGHGYRGNVYDFPSNRRYMKPRPFTAKTIANLAESKAHVAALRDGLMRLGVKVE